MMFDDRISIFFDFVELQHTLSGSKPLKLKPAQSLHYDSDTLGPIVLEDNSGTTSNHFSK